MLKPKRQRHDEDDDDKVDDDAVVEADVDPNGTSAVARGGTTTTTITTDREKLLERLSESQKRSVHEHLHGDMERRRLLKLDDDQANDKTPVIQADQHRHLQHRKQFNKKTTALLERLEGKRLQAAVSAVQAVSILQDTDAGVGLLETEHDMERTTAVTQATLKRQYLTATAAANIFDLQLPQYAPYLLRYDRSGRYSVLAGQHGHVAFMDNTQRSLVTEFHLPSERIRDVTFLHNFTLTAVAQRNHVYIYDSQSGAEVHCLQEHNDPCKLAFLPYHWLLASIGRAGYLKYQDTSTGQLVSTHRTQLGAATALRMNPTNAVLHAGHTNGTVTLWSPAQQRYLVKLLCHRGAAITALAVDTEGRTMVTTGQDRQIRVWDLRMYQERHSYYCSAGLPSDIDLSQRGLLAVGHSGQVTIWSADALVQKVKSPYMHHVLGPGGNNNAKGPVESVRFRPGEDVCGIGHAKGVSSIVVPGSGEPALDTFEYHTNPAQDLKQRREAEVRALLDKLSPDMIVLEDEGGAVVGGIEASDPTSRLERLQDLQDSINTDSSMKKKQKGKKRGRSKIQTKLRRKHKNIIDQNLLKLKEAREKETIVAKLGGTAAAETDEATSTKDSAPTSLQRFF